MYHTTKGTLSESEVTQLCPTFCDPMDCRLPGSSFHGLFQAGVLEWVAISFSKGSRRHRDQTHVSFNSCIGRQILYYYTTWEAHVAWHPPSISCLPFLLTGDLGSLGLTMEKAMATQSSTLAWKSPWTEEPGRLQSTGSLGVEHN